MNNSPYRINRKNLTVQDLGIKNQGGLNDLFDDAFKSYLRVNDNEYDFILEKMTDEELDLTVKDDLTFSEKKQLLLSLRKHLALYNKEYRTTDE